eukprot:Seg2516.3 transcript_id=Seg2516.3/GoldUCD/mRNA.D3Y31 product="hypothetical protein" protein_id=Seg2516.3/GoldUCD/D3Y31
MAVGGVEMTETGVRHLSGIAPPIATEKHLQTIDPDEIEVLILAAIKKIQESGKRADFESVPVYVEKHNGLARAETFQQLESMIANEKISNIHYRGKPSLRLPKDSERSEKERKVLNDEERLSECREKLQEMASRHCSSSRENSNEKSSDESADESEDTCNSSNSNQRIHGQRVLNPNEKEKDTFHDESKHQSQGVWGDWAVDYRLALLERKVDQLTIRFDSGQPATTAIDEVKNRVVVLKNEKMKLVDENIALKIENAELKGFIRGKVDTIENEVMKKEKVQEMISLK